MNKFGVIIKKSYSYDDGYDRGSSTGYYNELKEFESQQELEKYLLDNKNKTYYSDTIVKIIKFAELNVEFNVSVTLK